MCNQRLLVGALQAGLAKERVEPVVAAQRDEPLILDAVAALEDPRHRGAEVVVTDPVGDWVAQQARNLLMEIGDDLGQFRFVIRDRDTKFTAEFDAVFAAEAIKVLITPVRAPRAKALVAHCTS